ncbi:inositol monophosphatase [Aggregicoccus sp. 17bor-14]|uniref:inositol monophosphatase family protein n=1 Tax=Myxococcaceae TaxID=31 RepID=UPI00129D189A|nr:MULTISPECIES: inositol monophosphatase family protein [Myxococcaceae]MBF5042869.1 inositol monophosphatase [Simulacricoccus sp. 17bor-14]MRI88636.1 inositol monophosphatase [Aggregicoccus sp. 17bor-14]
MDPSMLNTLRRSAEEAAQRAGRVLAERFSGARTIEFKGGIDLVTDADKASEAELLSFLRARHPEHAVLAEESGFSAASASGGTGLRWIVDPLDGTTNYAHRVPHFCVSVAVDSPEGLLAGAIYEPLRGELYSAARGQGATLNGAPLRASSTAKLSQALVGTGFPYDVHERPEVPMGLLNQFIPRARGIRRMGSAALDLAYVAGGRYDAFFELGLKPWDIAAGALLMQEAGGVLTHVDGAPFTLARGDVLACAPGIAAECQQLAAGYLAQMRWQHR